MFCCGYDCRNEMTREEILREIARIEEEKKALAEIFVKYPEIREVRLQSRNPVRWDGEESMGLDLVILANAYIPDSLLNQIEDEIDSNTNLVPLLMRIEDSRYSMDEINEMELMYGAS